MTLHTENLITAAAAAGALGALILYIWKGFRWLSRQQEQDRDITALKEEQTLLTYGVLCCLKGLREKGCDGPVVDAIDRIEKHLNRAAHR